MKSALLSGLALLLALAGAAAAPGVAAAPRCGKVPGLAYVNLSEWARANGFAGRWTRTNETIELRKPAGRIALTVDSRQIQINGIAVWLFHPVVAQAGAAWLSRLDADLTLQPLLSPPRGSPGARVKTVCLDPGHGGKDPGNQAGANPEKRYTLLLAQEVQKQLARAGLKGVLTRHSDTFLELPARPALAQRKRADLFVSLHFNGAARNQDTVRGAEVFCLTPAGLASTNADRPEAGANTFIGNRNNSRNLFLAYQVQAALVRNLAAEDRGVRRARFAVLRDAAMPAVLIEAGFMSHPVEGRKILTAAYRQQIARAIVEGLLAYKKAVERPA